MDGDRVDWSAGNHDNPPSFYREGTGITVEEAKQAAREGVLGAAESLEAAGFHRSEWDESAAPPKPKRTKLEEGMLLLDPGKEVNGLPPRPSIYAVASKGGKVLVQHLEECSVRSTLTQPYLPDGWQVIGNRALAKYLVEHEDELRAEAAKAKATVTGES